MTRPTWEEYFVNMVNAVATRGTCDRGKAGAVIVKDNQVISTGYVGSAAGDDHCDETGHKYEYRIKRWKRVHRTDYDGMHGGVISIITNEDNISKHCIRTIHAEQNAICSAAKYGHSVQGSIMYTSMVPCRTCAMMIINSGITKVVALKEYQTSEHTKELFKKCNIELIILDSTLNNY